MLDGKKFLVTGVLTESSLAFSAARQLQDSGAEVLLTSFGRAARVTARSAARLPRPADVLELDVTRTEDFATVAAEIDRRWGRLDGALHAVAFAPDDCLGADFLAATWPDVSTALQVSAFLHDRTAQVALDALIVEAFSAPQPSGDPSKSR